MNDWRAQLVQELARWLGVALPVPPPARAPDPPPAGEGVSWPPLPEVAAGDARFDLWKLRYASELGEVAEKRRAVDPARSDRERAEVAHDFAVRLEILKAYLDVAKAAPERAKAAAQFVQTAASAVATIYTGVLALSFSGAANAVRLDTRALAPGLFLALAISLATAFLAFVTRGRASEGAPGSGDQETGHVHRLNAFIHWSRELVLRRVYLLRAGVISLSLGVALLPIPLIDPQRLTVKTVGWVAGLGLASTFLGPWVYGRVRPDPETGRGRIAPPPLLGP